MKQRKKSGHVWKGTLVVIIASMLTILAIHASDSFSIPGSSLLAGVGSATKPRCPDDMVYIPESKGGFCIDRYENSTGDHCTFENPSSQVETEGNINTPLCIPVSAPDRTPWVNIPEHEALALCAKAGKRLPSNNEWYRAALGTPDAILADGTYSCALGKIGQYNADKTGANPQCFSSYGVYDMVGNVWEWIDASVQDGKYESRIIPDDGYVAGADADGVADITATSSRDAYGKDYFYSDKNGLRGMFRGGFWSLSEKAGIYSINTANPLSFSGVAVGFRCVNTINNPTTADGI